jgi:hypothetical protein
MKKFLYFNFFIFLIISFSTLTFSQKLENVQFKQDGKKIVITYDLVGVEDSKTFEVQVEMSQDGGITFTTTPKTLTGDVGKEVKPGKSKKISWDVLKDIAELRGTDFVFKVIAGEAGTAGEEKTVESKGGVPTWVWIGGGVAVAGGAAAILLGGKKSNGTTTPPIPDLPTEPAWPPK